ncbi:cold shock domain-containing protein [Marivirga sp. S37H4]|uniref:Cold shock domain-containing protein n=1 Tax=Marivirga aurantiaca TaxID=2802615 RepID=A0A934X2S7_9BACT|nr:cold shock domain-containing protein [Marivirga aurantiaca]MBK6267426.1 cold shock domain-containing protein [Marivirga aurantiaca]
MNTGTVKFYNDEKGFGFIVEDETQNEIFVHASGLEEDIEKNDKVSFETTEGKKGLNAVNVRRV